MKLKYFHLAYESFWGKNLSSYFNTSIIINAFVTAFILWQPLLFEYFEVRFWPLHVSVFFIGFWSLLKQDYRGLFWTGAFIGLLWFSWISLSFIHYGFWYMIPFGILAIMLVYGFLFWFCGIWSNHPAVKAFALFLIGHIEPFGFNWFDWRLFLIDTPFRVDMIGVGIFISGVGIFLSLKSKFRWIGIIVLFFALEFDYKKPNYLPYETQIATTNIPQSQKWNPAFLNSQIEVVFSKIDEAISQKKSLIIFPESAFPLYLNLDENLRQTLLEYSHKISIIAGALTHTKEGIYNSSYFYHEGKENIAHKVILVPFGEAVPLPKIFKDLINRLFYGGASDFLTAQNPQNFEIFGLHVRSAICFEATRAELYSGSPGIMIALSNNAWFTPSLQPYLQRRLLRVYATIYETTIYHSVNGSSGGVIIPHNSPLLGYFSKALNSLM